MLVVHHCIHSITWKVNEYLILVRCFEETDISVARISCVPPQESLQSALNIFFIVRDVTLKDNIFSNTTHVNVLK